ncbi:unnamed protein product [Cuscuta europaea]|uniref:Zinc finger, CCHC-type, Gag-polypeptide of LTR copia-type n=1 Tax=Cuscuta europaea TaxID=41803 RepID=A0A9P1E073_CUSEU|nr:unnamed protein product [Cuscuta europaea]
MASNDSSLSLSTILHMLTIKLSSSNFLLWKNQIVPLLSFQKLAGHIDGTTVPPPATVQVDAKTVPNPEFSSWQDNDQRALILLHSSLSEEAMSEVLGLKTSHEVWQALQSAYSHDSVERMQSLRDSLRHLQKGNLSVSDYGRQFKHICDKLAAIGHPVDENDKFHWFLCGLGSTFETFSIAQRTHTPRPSFRGLLAQAESHELFLKNMHPTNVPQAAFTANHHRGPPPGRGSSNNTRGRNNNNTRGGFSGGRGRGRRPPHCQLCRKDGHYASTCPDLASFANRSSPIDANLATAFHSQCHVNNNSPDWYVDTGATAHMTPTPSNLQSSQPYAGKDQVAFGNASSYQGHSSSGSG